jgi:hypothetical protein
MKEILERLPIWLIAALLFGIFGLFAFGVVTNRHVSMWPPEIGPAERTYPACPESFEALNSPASNGLTLSSWRFGRSDGQQIAPAPPNGEFFKFGPGGEILGYDNPNERHWEVSGNQLLIFNEANAISTRYRKIRCYLTIELIGDATRHYSHVLSRPLN